MEFAASALGSLATSIGEAFGAAGASAGATATTAAGGLVEAASWDTALLPAKAAAGGLSSFLPSSSTVFSLLSGGASLLQMSQVGS